MASTAVVGFALQADPIDGPSWVELGRKAETVGFEAISVADHPGDTAAPFVALAVLAGATSTLALATAVLNIGAWEPLQLASEVATLDRLSGHRAILGVGAGHTPTEWTVRGRSFPNATERVAHLAEVVDATRALLSGDEVSMRSGSVRLDRATLRWPSGPRPAVPVLVGGNGRGVLRYGAKIGELIELTGLGPTLPDGHLHRPDWAPGSLDRRIDLIRGWRGDRPVRLGVLVQRVGVVEHRVDELASFRDELVGLMGAELVPSLSDLLETPYVLVGTEDEILDQLRRNDARWGITRYTVRADAADALAPIIERLQATSSGGG